MLKTKLDKKEKKLRKKKTVSKVSRTGLFNWCHIFLLEREGGGGGGRGFGGGGSEKKGGRRKRAYSHYVCSSDMQMLRSSL